MYINGQLLNCLRNIIYLYFTLKYRVFIAYTYTYTYKHIFQTFYRQNVNKQAILKHA